MVYKGKQISKWARQVAASVSSSGYNATVAFQRMLTLFVFSNPKNRDSKEDPIDDIIAFLKPLHQQHKIPKRLVNILKLLRSAFPGKGIKKSTIRKAYSKAGWDAGELCNLTNNEVPFSLFRLFISKTTFNPLMLRVDLVGKCDRVR